MSSTLKRLTTLLAAFVVLVGGAVALPSIAAAAVSGTLAVTNSDTLPSNSRIVLSRIQTPADSLQRFHDSTSVRLTNTGTGTLTVSSLRTTGLFTVTSTSALPINLAAGQAVNITVKFIAQSGGWNTGNLAIGSTSSTGATTNVALAGYWQKLSEHNLEPSLPSLVSNFGYKTVMPASSYSRGAYVKFSSDEVLSPYWKLRDPTKASRVTQIAAWHGYPSGNTFRTYPKGAPASYSTRLTGLKYDAQSAMPRNSASGKGTVVFQPTGTFGFILDKEYSDPTLNSQTVDRASGCTATQCGQHVRVFQLRNSAGALVAGSYLVTTDIGGINYDFQDNVYVVSNITPA